MILIIFIPFITKTEEILNKNYFTLKTAELNFLSHYLKDLRISKGLYFGVEGAFKILKRTYIAVETGFGNSKDRGIWKKENEIIFIPLELSLKHKFKITKRIYFNIGYGIMDSLVKVKEKYSREEDQSAGFQIFLDLNYNFKRSFIGITLKFQPMFEFASKITRQLGYDEYNNYRIGINFGYFLN